MKTMNANNKKGIGNLVKFFLIALVVTIGFSSCVVREHVYGTHYVPGHYAPGVYHEHWVPGHWS